ncbi:SAV_915 family protein [Streptomyces sp. NPDC018031]|uniref:SAV_915 family protein n=1 Tax=Streptomyces sp. NPDC018031 TaxID=3365033 RepID=UPI0037A69F36
MTHHTCGDDPEPFERFPAGPLYVPVRPGPTACAARLFRTARGGRTAVGFTSRDLLTAALGPGQAWIRLAAPALRALTAPLGVTTVTVDPQLTAPPAGGGQSTAPYAGPAYGPGPRTGAGLRATGSATRTERPARRGGREEIAR